MQTVTLLPTYIRSCRHVPHFVVSVGNAQSSCALVWLMDMHVCLCVYTAYTYVRSSYTHTHSGLNLRGSETSFSCRPHGISCAQENVLNPPYLVC